MLSTNIACQNCTKDFVYQINLGFICSHCGFLNSISVIENYNINYFSYLFLPISVMVNLNNLEQNFLQLMMLYHPDKFVSKTEVEKINALANTIYLNKAYDCLQSPLKTIEYLYFLLNKVEIINENETSKNNLIVMEFLTLYEELDSADTVEKKQNILNKINNQIVNFLNEISTLDFVKNSSNIKQIYIKLTYLYRIKEKIKI